MDDLFGSIDKDAPIPRSRNTLILEQSTNLLEKAEKLSEQFGQDLQALVSKSNDTQSELDQLVERCKDYEKQVHDLSQDCDRLQEQKNQWQQLKQGVQQQLDDWESKRNNLEKEWGSLVEEYKSLTESLN